MFLLDIRYEPKKSTITKWIKDGTGCKPVSGIFHPKIYVSLTGKNKHELQHLISSLPGVRETCIERKRTRLGSEPEEVLCTTMDPGSIYDTASMLEAKGCGLYNIDLDPVRQYLLERSLFPMARFKGDILEDDQYALDYEIPELTCIKLSVTPSRDRGIATMDDTIRRIVLGDTVIENEAHVRFKVKIA